MKWVRLASSVNAFPGVDLEQFRLDILYQINREVLFLLTGAVPKGGGLGGCDALSFQVHAPRFEMSW